MEQVETKPGQQLLDCQACTAPIAICKRMNDDELFVKKSRQNQRVQKDELHLYKADQLIH